MLKQPKKIGSSTVCAKTRRKIEKRERRNENTVYPETLRLTGNQPQRGSTIKPELYCAAPLALVLNSPMLLRTGSFCSYNQKRFQAQ